MAVAGTNTDYSRSTLNPNAPPFIPYSFQRPGDLSSSPPRRSEPRRLIKTSGWAEAYHWIDHSHRNHHGQVPSGAVSAVNGRGRTKCKEEEEDIAALLPETFEVEDFSLGLQEEAVPFHTHADQQRRGDAIFLQDKAPRLDTMVADSLTASGGSGLMSWSAVELRRQYWEEAAARSQWRHLQPYSSPTFPSYSMLASANQ